MGGAMLRDHEPKIGGISAVSHLEFSRTRDKKSNRRYSLAVNILLSLKSGRLRDARTAVCP